MPQRIGHGAEGPKEWAQPGRAVEVGRARRDSNAPPERLKQALGLGRTAGGETLDEHGRIHRSGAGTAGDRDTEAWLIQKTIQHAPGESPECAAALQSERHRTGRHGRSAPMQPGRDNGRGCVHGFSCSPSCRKVVTIRRAARPWSMWWSLAACCAAPMSLARVAGMTAPFGEGGRTCVHDAAKSLKGQGVSVEGASRAAE